MKKFLKYTLYTLVGLGLGITIFGVASNKKEPQSQTGEAAELVAQKMVEAVNKTAWDSTAWVKWDYGRNAYIWDKQRNMVQVTMGDTKVLLDIGTQKAISATKNGSPLSADATEKARIDAWKWFCNDSFWLHAPTKIFDEGTERSIVQLKDGKSALKIKYNSGGVTPGDTYLWYLDEGNVPTKYEMWVQIIPVGGITGTWEDWVTLPTGAKVATKHKIGGMLTVNVKGLEAGMGQAQFVP
jgi:hypothetical protein